MSQNRALSIVCLVAIYYYTNTFHHHSDLTTALLCDQLSLRHTGPVCVPHAIHVHACLGRTRPSSRCCLE
jgi:hypothetical protein